MVKRILLLVLLLFLVVSLGACSYKHIEDTNGENNFSIVSISDDKIISKSQNLTYGSVRTTKNGETTLKIKKMSGVMDLEKTKVDDQGLIYSVESTVNSGNFRIVVTLAEKIISDIEVNCKTDITVPNTKGTYVLKIVGESANFTMKYKIVKAG